MARRRNRRVGGERTGCRYTGGEDHHLAPAGWRLYAAVVVVGTPTMEIAESCYRGMFGRSSASRIASGRSSSVPTHPPVVTGPQSMPATRDAAMNRLPPPMTEPTRRSRLTGRFPAPCGPAPWDRCRTPPSPSGLRRSTLEECVYSGVDERSVAEHDLFSSGDKIRTASRSYGGRRLCVLRCVRAAEQAGNAGSCPERFPI